MQFLVKINLGSDAMRVPRDVAKALRRLADHLDAAGSGAGCLALSPRDSGLIRDANGNTIGRWHVKGEA